MNETLRQRVVDTISAWLGAVRGGATHKYIIDTYNAHQPLARGYKVTYTDAWCAATVSAVAIKLGITDIMPTECGCGEMVNLYQKLGRWVEDDGYIPKLGDVIFYDWGDSGSGDNRGWPDHVGIVAGVSNGIITVIEGNYSNKVIKRQVKVNDRYIRGYGIPDYESKPEVIVNKIAGRKIVLKSTPCYTNELAKVPYTVKSGTFYYWDETVKNGRIRITNHPERVGVSGQVTCWVDYVK